MVPEAGMAGQVHVEGRSAVAVGPPVLWGVRPQERGLNLQAAGRSEG